MPKDSTSPTPPDAQGSRQGDAVSGVSIGEYLIRRLQDYGVRHVFGIPGDYILSFYGMLEKSPLGLIGCTREDCAGFAADGYARLNGIGAVCVTYCVGGLSLCNSIGGAFAERSPVVVISGSPGMGERRSNAMLHHRVRDFTTQADVFRHICCAATELTDPATALAEIDRVLAAVANCRQPGYIELPRDLVAAVPGGTHVPVRTTAASDPDSLCEAVGEAMRRITAAQRPIIVAKSKLLAIINLESVPEEPRINIQAIPPQLPERDLQLNNLLALAMSALL